VRGKVCIACFSWLQGGARSNGSSEPEHEILGCCMWCIFSCCKHLLVQYSSVPCYTLQQSAANIL
jgi:hypothetical protein